MEVINKVYPDEEQIKGFREPGAEGPICMVNLLTGQLNIETTDFSGQWLEGSFQ